VLLGTFAFVGASRHAISYERVVHPKEYWITYSETTSTLNENLPINFHLYKAYEIKDTVFKDDLVWSDDPDADVHITYWNVSSRAYSILVNQPSTVVERTAYFPGWQTSANNLKVQVDFHDPWEAGLLTYHLDPGSYEIKTKFTQNTPIRKIGNWLTLVGIGWITLIYVRKIKNGRG